MIQYAAIPTMTVPPSDLVFRAKNKVGIAARNLGCSIWNRPVDASRKIAGATSALKIHAGMNLSHSFMISGISLVDSHARGIHRGMKVTSPMPSTQRR
jgi:hypothetical protein